MTAFANLGAPHTDTNHREHLSFLLDRFCDADPTIANAIAISSDGLPMAASRRVDAAWRDQLAASAVGHMSMAKSTATMMEAGGVERIVINHGHGWLLIQQPNKHVVLIVLASHQADLALVDDQLMRLGEAIGPVLDPGPVPA